MVPSADCNAAMPDRRHRPWPSSEPRLLDGGRVLLDGRAAFSSAPGARRLFAICRSTARSAASSFSFKPLTARARQASQHGAPFRCVDRLAAKVGRDLR